MPDENLGTSLTLRAWDEAWSHSRHLETMRSQYLGFFFTAAFAVTAFTARQVGDDGLRTSSSLLTIAVLAIGLNGMSIAFYLAVVRINSVLLYYRQIIFAIQEGVQEQHDPPVRLPAYRIALEPRGGSPLRVRIRTTQGVVEAVLLSGVGVFSTVLGADALRASTLHGASTTSIVLCWLSFATGVAIDAAGWWSLRSDARPSADSTTAHQVA